MFCFALHGVGGRDGKAKGSYDIAQGSSALLVFIQYRS